MGLTVDEVNAFRLQKTEFAVIADRIRFLQPEILFSFDQNAHDSFVITLISPNLFLSASI